MFKAESESFATKRSRLCQIQLKAFDKSVRIAPKTLLLLTDFFHLFIIERRQYCGPNRFQKPR